MFKFLSNEPDEQPKQSNFHPVTSAFPPTEFVGALEPQDTEWACGSGFVTETQCWYHVFDDGVFMMCQVIYSSIGLWIPTVQFTFKIYDPRTKEQIWASANVSKWTTPPPASSSRTFDKRSSQSDKFKIFHTPATASAPESYKIDATPNDTIQISMTIVRPSGIPGFKLGAGPRGGHSYFGNLDKPEGFAVHRFWPRTESSGVVIVNGKAYDAKGLGMFVHAIQGMRPNLVAERWNFGFFQSPEEGGVTAIQMEFETLESFGRKPVAGGDKIVGQVKVNVGCVVAGGKLVLVTGETLWADENEGDKTGVVSRARPIDPVRDPETGYKIPSKVEFVWKGPALPQAGTGQVEADLTLDMGSHAEPKGLLMKYDVLSEIPYVVRKMVNYVAGTKPYIYQYFNPATLNLKLPAGIIEGKESLSVQGTLFSEVSVISNPDA